jgi:hypothetical protein
MKHLLIDRKDKYKMDKWCRYQAYLDDRSNSQQRPPIGLMVTRMSHTAVGRAFNSLRIFLSRRWQCLYRSQRKWNGCMVNWDISSWPLGCHAVIKFVLLMMSHEFQQHPPSTCHVIMFLFWQDEVECVPEIKGRNPLSTSQPHSRFSREFPQFIGMILRDTWQGHSPPL